MNDEVPKPPGQEAAPTAVAAGNIAAAGPNPPAANHARRIRKRVVFFLLIAAIVTSVFFWQRQAVPQPKSFPNVEMTSVDPEVRKAIEAARERLDGQRSTAEAWGEFGMVLYANEFENEANECFEEAERLNPNDARWPYYRGLYAQSHTSDGVPRGLPHYRRAAAIGHGSAPYAAMLRIKLAEALLEKFELDEAEAIFKEVCASDATNARAAFGLGSIALARNDIVDAELRMTTLVQSPFCRQKSVQALALLSRRSGKTEAAKKYQELALSLQPDQKWLDPFVEDYLSRQTGRRQMARVAGKLQSEGRHREVLQIWVQLCQNYPTADNYLQTASAFGKLGDFASAERYVRRSLQLDPECGNAIQLLGLTLFSRAEQSWQNQSERDKAKTLLREAVPLFRKGLQDKPDNPDGYLLLGRSLFLLGDISEAVDNLKLAIACRPDRYEAHLYLGEALIDSGKLDAAFDELQSAQHLARPKETRHVGLLERLSKTRKTPRGQD